MKKSKSILRNEMLIFILVVVVFTSFLFIGVNLKKQSRPSHLATTEKQLELTNNGWKTYINEQERYKMQYPDDWYKLNSSANPVSFSNEDVGSPLEMTPENGVFLSIWSYNSLPEWKKNLLMSISQSKIGDKTNTELYTFTRTSDFQLGQSNGYTFSSKTNSDAAIEAAVTQNYVVVSHDIPIYYFELLSASDQSLEKDRNTVEDMIKSLSY